VVGRECTEAEEIAERALGAGTFSVEKFVDTFPALAKAAGGTTRLREMVRDLAVRGSLATQAASDRHASTLVAGAEPLPADVVRPVSLPTSWIWTAFPNVAEIASNLVNPAKFGGMPHVAPDNIEKGTGRLLPYRTIAEDGVTSGKHRFYAGQVLYSKIRPNLNKVVVVDFDGLCSADMYPLTPHFDARYLQLFMLSALFLTQVVRSDNRLAMPKVNQEQLRATLVALPPLAEQKRIVARVDQLMALIDQLEAKQNRKRDLGARFTKASLEALTTAESPQDFTTAWTRVHQTWPTLLDHPDKTEVLRGAILDLAVRGALCRSSGIAFGSAGNTPSAGKFQLPGTWAWTQFCELCDDITVGHVGTMASRYVAQGIPFLRSLNVEEFRFDPRDLKFIDERFHSELRKSALNGGEILAVRSGNVGRSCVFPNSLAPANCSDLVIFRPGKGLLPEYGCIVLNSPYGKRHVLGEKVGIAQSHFNVGSAKTMPTPLPPLGEQKRIVAKVEHLMKLCDALEAALRRREDRAAKLAEAVVQEMVA
jgi:type I restriction enzyme S subunit